MASETGVIAKKRSAAFLDTVLTALGRRLKATAARPSCSSFMLKGELHNPKNPEYAGVRDTESAKGELVSVRMKLRAADIPVSLENMRDAFLCGLPEEVRKETTLHGFARLESRTATGVYKAVYDEAFMIARASSRRRVHTAQHQDAGDAEEDSRTTSRCAR